MAAGSGIAAQIGFGVESGSGVEAVPTVFVPLVEESLSLDIARMESEGIIPGQRGLRDWQSVPGAHKVGGDTKFELTNRGLGVLWQACLGAVSTNGAGPYTHVFTPGDLPSLTAQVGRPDTSGTVRPFSYRGLKVSKWELAAKVGEIATFGITFAGRAESLPRTVADGATTSGSAAITSATAAFTAADVGAIVSGTGIPAATTISAVTSATTATMSANASATAAGVSVTIGQALATASYPTSVRPLTFLDGSVTIGGVASCVEEVTFAGAHDLADDRGCLGTALTKEPVEKGLRVYDGKMSVEFSSMDAYTRYRSGATTTLSLAFASGTDTLTIAATVRYDGSTPQVKGRDILQQDVPFKVLGTGSAEVTATLVNADATP